jgi:phosphate transport system substrate-binding protein
MKTIPFPNIKSLVRILFCTAFLFADIFAIHALADTAPGETILTIHGSNTIGAKLVPDIARRFLKQNGYNTISKVMGEKENEFFITAMKDNIIHNIEIKAHGSSTSFISLKEGYCDIGMSSRRIKDDEVAELAFLGDMTAIDNEHILAIDGIAVVVNKANTIEALDVATLQEIFSGKLNNWQALGGIDSPIHVYARDDNSGTYDTFKSMVLKKIALKADVKRYESNAQLSDDVSQDISGIGFVGMPFVRNAKALQIRQREGAPGYLPTTFTAAYEEYPLSRRLYLYTAEEPKNQMAKKFAEFALSHEGQKSVALLGFAKLSLDMEERNINPERFHNPAHQELYDRETRGGRRVNFNFRFDPDDNSLESRSQKDLQRFIHYIQQPDQYYYETALIGINSCFQAETMLDTIIETIGRNNFHVIPKKFCLDYAVDGKGRPFDSLIEVWLRVVDDGA